MRNDHAFMRNPYIAGVKHGGRDLYFILSESSVPLMEDNQIAVFGSVEEAQEIYKKHLYRGKKSGASIPVALVLNYGEMLDKYPNVAARLAPALGQEGLAPVTPDIYRARMEAGRVGRIQAKVEAARASDNKSRRGYSQGAIRMAQINLQIPEGGLGAAAKAAYKKAEKGMRVLDALQAAGVTPEMMETALSVFRRLPEGASSAEKKAAILRGVREAGIPYTPVAKKPAGSSPAATGEGVRYPMHPGLTPVDPASIVIRYN